MSKIHELEFEIRRLQHKDKATHDYVKALFKEVMKGVTSDGDAFHRIYGYVVVSRENRA